MLTASGRQGVQVPTCVPTSFETSRGSSSRATRFMPDLRSPESHTMQWRKGNWFDYHSISVPVVGSWHSVGASRPTLSSGNRGETRWLDAGCAVNTIFAVATSDVLSLLLLNYIHPREARITFGVWCMAASVMFHRTELVRVGFVTRVITVFYLGACLSMVNVSVELCTLPRVDSRVERRRSSMEWSGLPHFEMLGRRIRDFLVGYLHR